MQTCLSIKTHPSTLRAAKDQALRAFDTAVSATSMISQEKVDRGPTDYPVPPGRDTLNFHVRLHARSVTATCRWFCTPLVYQIETIGWVREAWRVLAILSRSMSGALLLSIIPSSIHTAPASMYRRKISILHLDDPRLAWILGRRIDRREEKTTVSHRRRRFAVVNNFS